jgi:cyclase
MRIVTALFALFALMLIGNAFAADAPSVKTTAIKNNLYLLQGRGGNVVASVGEDGALLIDDDYGQFAEAYKHAVAELGAKSVRFVINTHWHGDHTGSNAFWGDSGAVIVAHDNVRVRMSTRQENKIFGRVTEPSPQSAWPVVTYADSSALHFNGDILEIQHYPTGHTDGDSVVFFLHANVVHMGDHFFKDRFPFIDLGSGGSPAAFISNVEQVLAKVDDQTVIVPGHGDLANKAELKKFLGMLNATRAEVLKMKAAGMSLEDMQAAGLDARWESWGSGFINSDSWIATLASE